ncbi:response regulator transcription factor [Paenibacillus eucommiae]|uniref:Two-component system response regulator YesN n=1 Tax=Paenibacillus eucommiae TaxID=1355755 RepID=A0ABS4IM46_9BACL|nr:response regulator [Paenibacillus eucommiae]MBP1988643.1 two-component system response regulator YesN [Paenibacillus eucommiae]
MMLQVLVVEDERWIRQSICKMIGQIDGCQVAGEAKDGQEGLRLLKELAPDVLMTDIHMPVMNGLQLIGEARRLLPKLEIILFSGFNDFDYVREGLRQGVHDYLLKPIQPEELYRVTQQVAQKIAQKKGKLPQQFVWIEAWRGNAKRLAEYLWLADKPKFEAEWSLLSSEWIKHEKEVEDVYEFFHLLVYILNERIRENYGAQLPEQIFHPLDFTGDAARDADMIREHLLGVMNELLTERNWRKSHVVVKAVSYIEAQYANPHLSLFDAAELIGLSHPYLSRLFKEEMGKTFVEYVTELRINKAREMLGDPDVKVYEVAGAVGYTEYTYFVRVFKRVVGYSPSDYRKQLGIR